MNRIAFCGGSGTGKSTLATWVSETWGLELNPVGSRSVSKAMGFESPYDVDKAGKRAEFQRRLVLEKCAWEAERSDFVTDRTTLDNLVYTMLHDVHAIDEALFESIRIGLDVYTQIIYCPVWAFCDPAGDKDRVQDLTYHKLFDHALHGLLDRLSARWRVRTLAAKSLEERKQYLSILLGKTGSPGGSLSG